MASKVEAQTRKLVWYIEARNERSLESKPNMGSAVAVKLGNNEGVARLYLLTCAHVAKSITDQKKNLRYGTGDLKQIVLCWRPFRGYGLDGSPNAAWPTFKNHGIYKALVFDLFNRSPGNDWTEEDCTDTKDWLLLDIQDKEFQDVTEYCYVKRDFADAEGLSIIGFPAGANNWIATSNVENNVSRGQRISRTADIPGIARLDGGEAAAPGVSGGGVFNLLGELVGIYRGSNPDYRSKSIILASTIVEQLRGKGFNVVQPVENPDPPDPDPPKRPWPIIVVICAIVLALFLWLWKGCPDGNGTPLRELNFENEVAKPLAVALSETGEVPPLLKGLENQEAIFLLNVDNSNRGNYLERIYKFALRDSEVPKTVELKVNGDFDVIKSPGSMVKVKGHVRSIGNPAGSTIRVEVIVDDGSFID